MDGLCSLYFKFFDALSVMVFLVCFMHLVLLIDQVFLFMHDMIVKYVNECPTFVSCSLPLVNVIQRFSSFHFTNLLSFPSRA